VVSNGQCIDTYIEGVVASPVVPDIDPEAIQDALSEFDFTKPMVTSQAFELAVSGLTRQQTHAAHS
jgi:hypothetical protein